MNDDKVNRFLANIGQIESSGGKNTKHKTITSGPQKGQTAIGTYGLLPNTVDEIANRSSDPDIQALGNMEADEQKSYLESNPDMEQKVARELASHVLNKQGGNEEKAAYSWLYGHNLSPESVDERDYQDEPYVQKYKALAGNVSKPSYNFPQIQSKISPLSVEGSPDEDSIKSYLGATPQVQQPEPQADSESAPETDPEVSSVKNIFDKQQADMNNHLSNMPQQTSEPQPYKAAPISAPAFDKLKAMMSNQPAPILQPRNLTLAEVLNNIKQKSRTNG